MLQYCAQQSNGTVELQWLAVGSFTMAVSNSCLSSLEKNPMAADLG